MYNYLKTTAESDRLRTIIAAVRKLPNRYASMTAQTKAVCRIFRGCGRNVWRQFDERSWGECSDRFHIVRQVRNDRAACEELQIAVDATKGGV